MRITGRDFGPVFVKAESGVITQADRPVSYMKNWQVSRVLKLAERWGWKVDIYDNEREQLEQPPEPVP